MIVSELIEILKEYDGFLPVKFVTPGWHDALDVNKVERKNFASARESWSIVTLET